MSSLIQAGLNVTAIGMGVVFVLLTLLVFIVRGMSALALKLAGPARTASSPALPATPTSSPNQELVSVISAAVAAYRKRR